MNDGWIKLSRKLLDWEWHDEPGTLSLFIHLLLMAQREKTTKKGITLERGQLITTLVELQGRTGLTERKVRDRLDILIRSGNVSKKASNKYTVITVCNYDKYQCETDAKRQTKRQTKRQQDVTETSDETSDLLYNKNIRKKEYILSNESGARVTGARVKDELEKRKKEFYDSLIPYVEIYGKQMIRDFYDYWTEENKSGTKFRRELERTWSLERRLKTWANREPIYSNNNGTGRNNSTAVSRYKTAAEIVSELIADGAED